MIFFVAVCIIFVFISIEIAYTEHIQKETIKEAYEALLERLEK